MIALLAVPAVVWAWRMYVRVAAAERAARAALRMAEATARSDAMRAAAVLQALRKVAAVVADEVQPALGTLREADVCATAIAYYEAIETIENTKP